MPDLYFPKRTGPSKAKKKADAKAKAKAFQDAVWIREGGRDRATDRILVRESDYPAERGDVCHLKGRRVMPEWKTDPKRAVLLSRENHILSDGRGGYRLKATDPETGDPAVDASKPIRWTLYDKAGAVQWTRIR